LRLLESKDDGLAGWFESIPTQITFRGDWQMSAKIRMRLNPDESMSSEIKPFVRMFLCECEGVILRRRAPGDNHVIFEYISEDDEYWFPYTGSGASSFWIDAALEVLHAAKDWCEKKCDKDPEGFGWRFKEGVQEMQMVRGKNGSLRPVVPKKG
jgi:hypothetical protein